MGKRENIQEVDGLEVIVTDKGGIMYILIEKKANLGEATKFVQKNITGWMKRMHSGK